MFLALSITLSLLSRRPLPHPPQLLFFIAPRDAGCARQRRPDALPLMAKLHCGRETNTSPNGFDRPFETDRLTDVHPPPPICLSTVKRKTEGGSRRKEMQFPPRRSEGSDRLQTPSAVPVGSSVRGSDESGALSSRWHLATVCALRSGDQNVSKATSHQSTCGVFGGYIGSRHTTCP